MNIGEEYKLNSAIAKSQGYKIGPGYIMHHLCLVAEFPQYTRDLNLMSFLYSQLKEAQQRAVYSELLFSVAYKFGNARKDAYKYTHKVLSLSAYEWAKAYVKALDLK